MAPAEEGGGRRPRKMLPTEAVVEEAPSHDGSPCFTAYSVDAEQRSRPLFALRVYDTAPEAGGEDRTRQLALGLHSGTESERCHLAPALDRDRVEVVGLPMPADTPDERRVEACRAHHAAEAAARLATRAAADFYLPATFDAEGWWRGLVIIDRLEAGWEGAAGLGRRRPGEERSGGMVPPSERRTDPLGGFLYVRWELTGLARRQNEEDPLPEVAVTEYPVYCLAGCLADLRDHMGAFRCFVQEGGLERELQAGVSLGPTWER